MSKEKTQFDLIVIGGGPGGYGAALYASAAGLEVALVENAKLGKELAEERKKTGALENIGQDIFKGWWG